MAKIIDNTLRRLARYIIRDEIRFQMNRMIVLEEKSRNINKELSIAYDLGFHDGRLAGMATKGDGNTVFYTGLGNKTH